MVVVTSWLWLLLCHACCRGCCVIVVLSWSSWSWSWSHYSHRCVVSTKSRLSRRPSAFWLGVKSQNTTIRHVIGVIECDVLPLVIFIIMSSHYCCVIVVTLSWCRVTSSLSLCRHCRSHHVIAIMSLPSCHCHHVIVITLLLLLLLCHHVIVIVVIALLLLLLLLSCCCCCIHLALLVHMGMLDSE